MSAAAPVHAPGPYALKRPLDLLSAVPAMLLSAPFLLLSLLLVFLQDFRNPLYVSTRIGRAGRPFRFFKVRTMRVNAASSQVDTTVAGDPRLTPVGRAIRVLKFDELPQFLHVLCGQMSMVGPRPNVPREVALYTSEEMLLLSVPPGITDLASIVFADLAATLANAPDANIAYNQLVRPWKSRLGLHYLRCASPRSDLLIICYTVSVLFARQWTLRRIAALLRGSGAPEDLCRFVLRDAPLQPMPPPGASDIVTTRSVK